MPFTQTLPKPCLPFLNLPLMNYSFYWAHQTGCRRFVFNTHHLPQKIKTQVEHLKPFAEQINISSEVEQILGSGGALWKAKEWLKDDAFLVANGDEVLLTDPNKGLKNLYNQFQQQETLCTLLTCDHPDLLKKFKAVWVNKAGEVRGFGLKPPESELELKPVHYTGYKIFSPRIFDFLPPGESNIFYDVLVKAMASGEKVTHHHLSSDLWFETGDFSSFLSASLEVSQNHWSPLKNIHSFFNQNLEKESLSPSDHLIFHKGQRPPASWKLKGLNVIGKDNIFTGQIDLENTFVVDRAKTLTAKKNYSNTFVF